MLHTTDFKFQKAGNKMRHCVL